MSIFDDDDVDDDERADLLSMCPGKLNSLDKQKSV